MNTAFQPFDEALTAACEDIRNACRDRATIECRGAFARGVVHGYYLSDVISLRQANDAYAHIGRACNARMAILGLEQQARAEGLA